jgi:Family of unknown function (DUF6065)
VPLEGLVKTDFPFTMTWRSTRAGTVGFERGKPFRFITPFPLVILDRIQPMIRSIEDDPELKVAYEAWAKGRADFNVGLGARDPEAVAEGWQRRYMRGQDATGRQARFHPTKRRVKPFRQA